MAPCQAARVQVSIAAPAFGSRPGSKPRAPVRALPFRIAGQSLEAGIATSNPLRLQKRSKVSVICALAQAQPSVALRNAEKSMQLPIDYYQILGAEPHFSTDAVMRAYEARVSNPPTEGFSVELLKARQQILKVACDTLADRDLRDEYDHGLKEDEAGTLVVEVPWSKIPAALCLLQEAGEAEVVLQVGEALLDENLKKPFKQDVVLVTALAYVELSREAMTENPPAVIRSCDMLNGALRLLQAGGNMLAPSLQEEVYETLEEITPRCVLELLALPLDEEHKSQRSEGLQEVRNILWTAGEGGLMAPVGGYTREQFMKEALSRMTACEQVALFTETPTNIPAEKLEIYSAALAHVAEGFKTKKPRLIQEGGSLFTQLHQSLGDRNDNHLITDEQRDVMLGRALSALLLGEVENCKNFLGLNDVNSPDRCPEVADFVLSGTDGNGDSDLLPGLCKLLESWLAEEVFTNFRETADFHVSLSDYYDDAEVLGYLEKLEKGSFPQEAAAAIARLGEGVTKHSSNRLLPLQIACIAAVFGGLAIASVSYPPFQKVLKSWRVAPLVPALTSAMTLRKGTTEQKEVLRMDARLAEQLIRKWQAAKAKALGVTRGITQLNEILDGQMLKSWTDRAVEVAKHGWYWEYKLLEINIDSVTISEDGRRAMVEATLEETARLYDSNNPQRNDSYKSSYTTRYELHYGDAGWRITDGAVLRT
ncbi:protein ACCUMULATION AND REPLICATION OF CHLOROPLASTS 6, chloroplastic isoform X1 [Selaginella moellendorffii]|uniref:protein ACCUMULATION AND REPLICATION OF CHLOROPLASTS 6, chloroplastic isoform X1 n=1 Tax=Selaginella moellendorffii TaxID=88036 RepID=UPI000D1CD947|nr:protein ACCUMULATION AND REPLICATION OF CHLOROPLASTS 6, chloroplastic isoform X1 [Selaginella moellendorffii]|eukprot:XP_024530626.1 protein ACCUMULATION AND REPLICATION OF CHLOROPLASTS 6, chloroplastic isoform X1 [Selaginella moellendorffii]